MITTRINFVLKPNGLVGWQLNELKTLSHHFRSVVVVFNLTRDKKALLTHTLQVLSMGSNPGDLCQIAIEGLDAELACMVITEYLRDHSLLISTSHKQNRHAEHIFNTHSAFKLPFSLKWHYSNSLSCPTKQTALYEISQQLVPHNPIDILQALEQRETVSSTLIGSGIALPHIMHPSITHPILAVHVVDNELNWSATLSPVSMIITLLLPSACDKTVLKPITKLTRWLLDQDHRQLLIDAQREETIKAILLHVMVKEESFAN
ncbi:PTS sugar transporter subunit IIA [Vibrio aestuarianus]|uniref:PTS sugar transporter subunit IIA n=1 Tax=Vibrio aestuarianus TaxID=28171 RepID=UPI00237D19CD|nr:PTS sugar transporter subunit IIA [Vibrio aestuarianus]MDE1249760.1 PTS sugar transporter subunit IIA [Vibrio aestuarianus]